ncbi:MAG: glycerol-3-phosphate 1-O-acyltransferase PlsY [Bacteroidetes bacterium]|nr:glycerol-3-phosphate 1-O-acyltransferase PlsY [Bacteroidota bacterium]
MQLVVLISIIISAYLLGSIPTSVWVGKIFYGIDIREYGSGNAGATNTIRVLGWKAGLPVMIVDVLKGFAAVTLIRFVQSPPPGTDLFVNYQLMLGGAAVIGHIFPVFARFRGGKGVATLFGMILAISPFSTLVCAGVFFLTLFLTKYVSLSSILAGFTFPVAVIVIFHTSVTSMIVFSITVSVLLLLTHQKNIGRLLRKEESKATFLFHKREKINLRPGL